MKRSPRRFNASHDNSISYALRLLRYRSRSRSEMMERLGKRGYSPRQVKRTICYLLDLGLLDDNSLVQELFTNAVARRYLGRAGIRAFLSRRGIDYDLIRETLSNHTRDMEIASARSFVKKRGPSLAGCSDDVRRRRIRSALQRRGFSSEVIRDTMTSASE